jgi:GNAT superfamily N-acetyltransferase
MSQVLYRPAVSTDVNSIKELTDVMLSHTGLGVATLSKIKALVTSPRCLVELAFINDELVGYTCGVLHENVFNDVLRVTDIGVFVLPQYRKLDVAKVLIEHLEKWAKLNMAKEIWLGQTTGDNVDVVAEYYRRLGFNIRGFNAVKEL